MAFMITNVTANATTIDSGIALPANAAIGIGRKRIAPAGVITAIEVMTACRTFRLRFRCEGPGSRFSAAAWLTGSLLFSVMLKPEEWRTASCPPSDRDRRDPALNCEAHGPVLQIFCHRGGATRPASVRPAQRGSSPAQ